MTVTVYKRDHLGNESFHYETELIERGETWICVQAQFLIRERADVTGFVILKGDLMTEWFYTDRYYNVFRVQDGTTGTLKGWYCNITRPAYITENMVSADDLALDVVVNAAGEIVVLDEDEFAALNLPEHEYHAALQAVETIRQLAASRIPPF